jgi:hypothetical protein
MGRVFRKESSNMILITSVHVRTLYKECHLYIEGLKTSFFCCIVPTDL